MSSECVQGSCVCLFTTEWWPLSVLFIRSQSSVLSHLSLEDRSISNHNRWRCYLNNESKLKQGWHITSDRGCTGWERVTSANSLVHTRMSAHKSKHAHTHIDGLRHSSESLVYFTVSWRLSDTVHLWLFKVICRLLVELLFFHESFHCHDLIPTGCHYCGVLQQSCSSPLSILL